MYNAREPGPHYGHHIVAGEAAADMIDAHEHRPASGGEPGQHRADERPCRALFAARDGILQIDDDRVGARARRAF